MPADHPDRRPGRLPGRPKPTYVERRSAHAEVNDPAAVLAAAARLLETRARSVQEVRRRLADGGYRAELVDGAIDRLVELGMLDDQAFARAWVESRDRAQPRGTRVLRDELRRKGVAQATVDAILAERDGLAEDPPGDGSAGNGAPPREAPAFGQLRPRLGSQLEPGEQADAVAARRLLARHAAALDRVSDPRKRRQRAYGLLARNGFAPDLISGLVRELGVAGAADHGEPEVGDADGDAADEAASPGV